MKKIFETGVILFAAMGFWGMIYPDLCFVEDVCMEYCIAEADIYTEDCMAEETAEVVDSDLLQEDIFTRLCMAQPEQIQVKSKFLEVLITESKGSSNVVNKR